MAEREETFQAAVIEYARIMGWLVYHTRDSRRSAPGFPDLTLVRGPRLLFAELKAENGRVRPEQQQWLDALEQAGQQVHVWRPSQWTQIIEALERRPSRRVAA